MPQKSCIGKVFSNMHHCFAMREFDANGRLVYAIPVTGACNEVAIHTSTTAFTAFQGQTLKTCT